MIGDFSSSSLDDSSWYTKLNVPVPKPVLSLSQMKTLSTNPLHDKTSRNNADETSRFPVPFYPRDELLSSGTSSAFATDSSNATLSSLKLFMIVHVLY